MGGKQSTSLRLVCCSFNKQQSSPSHKSNEKKKKCQIICYEKWRCCALLACLILLHMVLKSLEALAWIASAISFLLGSLENLLVYNFRNIFVEISRVFPE